MSGRQSARFRHRGSRDRPVAWPLRSHLPTRGYGAMKHARTFFAILAVFSALSVDPADAQDEPALLSPASLLKIMRIEADFGPAQDLALSPVKQDCAPDEPDSVQISWDVPCESGTWLMDTETGCRMWDWHPDPSDTATWTGACPVGLKEGRGVVQWFEHSEHIDRFEGTYRLGRRQGFGHYVWNKTDWYEGNYEDDRPHGFGTVHIAGEVFAGRWTNGCLKNGERIVAISVPRSSCAGLDDPVTTKPRQTNYRKFNSIPRLARSR
jgi:hypothetical protein